MIWWVIGFVMLAALAPLLWAMPSKRERRLARLREAARTRGVAVQLSEIDDPDPPFDAVVSSGGRRKHAVRACTAYRIPLPRTLPSARGFRTARRAASEGPPCAGWIWQSGPGQLSARDKQALCMQLDEFPPSVLAVELAQGAVALFWTEAGDDQQLSALLDRLTVLRDHFAASDSLNDSCR